MKNYSKKIFILIMSIILLFSGTPVFALAEINTEKYKPNNISSLDSSRMQTTVGGILGVINVVGVVCSVLVICIIGLRYMLGSVEQKAEYKKTMLGYFIGALLLFSATTLPNALYNIGKSLW